jgi:Family of unknown function (DUF5627)/Domain of unknown function (DUF1735)
MKRACSTVRIHETDIACEFHVKLKTKINKGHMKMKKLYLVSLVLLAILTSCANQDWEFADYPYQSVYFAYQYPVRTITLGEDIYDNTLDNQHKCMIMATTGGVYDNKKDITIDVQVDNSLCNGLIYDKTTNPITPLPSSYYRLLSDKITISKGSLQGGVEVELTDEFFADPLALTTKYVIPLVMTRVQNADTILSGSPMFPNPNRCKTADWNVVPKDYVLYAVKYINPWHGYYLRRGKDVITGSVNNTITRHQQYVEKDQVCMLTTSAYKVITFPVAFTGADGKQFECNLTLTFDDSDKCVITSSSTDFTATGTGQFVKKGDKKSWGNTDRDVLYLDYQINHTVKAMQIATKDTLVMRNRGVTLQTFNVAQ